MPVASTAMNRDPEGFDRDRLIALPEVLSLVGLRRSAWLARVKCGNAPQPVRLGTRCTRWSEREVLLWVANRLAERTNVVEASADGACND